MTDRQHVLFVVIDSARKERVSAYGHERDTTPHFDALAEEGTIYENAFVPAPWTLPSHWSMFTGRFPSEHGVTNGFTDEGLHRPDGVPTIAEVLSERGYRTAGFSNNPWVGKLSGLDRGFDTFVEWDLETSRSDETATRTRDDLYSRFHWLLGRAANQPQVILKRRFFTSHLVNRTGRWISEVADDDTQTFTFLNVMEAHSPYYPPRKAFTQLDLSPPNPVESRLLNVRLLAYVLGKKDLTPEQRERVMEFYDASLRFQDEQLGLLLDRLKREGIYEDTTIVVCADHGKTLGEYDRDGTPPHYLRDINTNVPMAVKPAGGSGPDRVEEPFELTELFDLLTDDAGPDEAPVPEPTEVPTPEATDIPTPNPTTALVEDYIPHTGREASEVTQWRALADEEYKYLRSDEGEEFLFRRDTDTLVEDPPRRREYGDRLDRRLDDFTFAADAGETSDEAIGSAVEGQLEDLGYLG